MRSALDRELTREVLGAGLLAAAGVAGVGALLVVGQTLVLASVLPGPGGMAIVSLGLLPAVLGVALPAGLLVGCVAVGRRWAEAGDGLALQASGYGARRLLPTLLAIGAFVGCAQATLSHVVEPLGRAAVRRALEGASSEIALVAGQPVSFGGVLIHAGAVHGAELEDLFVAADRVVVSAARGRILPGGTLELEQGMAGTLAGPEEEGEGEGYRLRFERARLPLDPRRRRVELIERSHRELTALIARMHAEGRAAAAETLALYKRTSLPLGAPLLALLGLPLGARGARPGPAAALTALLWWAAVRVCDQSVDALGPALAAALPLGLASVAVVVAWLGWRER